jgi:thioredoxin 2
LTQVKASGRSIPLQLGALGERSSMADAPRHIVCPHCDSVNRIPANKSAREAKCGRCHNALFTGMPVAVSAQSFERHLQRNTIPVLVDFWAEWCGPCKMIAPHLEEISAALGDKVKIVKLNIDENQQTAMNYQILAIPTMVLFRDGQEAHRIQGAMPKRRLEAELEPALT